MLTNPSTLGVFERRIEEVARIVHEAGGLLYYDGANLNAILGKVRPGDMGFDVIHMNLHKTFSTPHGGGGPGAGAVGVERAAAAVPAAAGGRARTGERYRWLTEKDLPQSIGRLSAFMGNAGVLLRAYIYMRLLGPRGHEPGGRVRHAQRQLPAGAAAAGRLRRRLSERRASHEFIITLKRQARELDVTAMDFAKRLLDHGFHAPDHLLPAAGAGVPADRAHRDREQGHARRLRRGHGADPEGSRAGTRARDERSAYHAGAAAGRRPGGQATGSHMEADSAARRSLQTPRRHAACCAPSAPACTGLAGAFREEAAFRQELALAVVVIPLGLWLGHSGIERALLVGPMLLVLIVELLNSAIEATVDRIGFERHALAGLAKDIGSAAVLMSFVLLVVVWLLVLLGR